MLCCDGMLWDLFCWVFVLDFFGDGCGWWLIVIAYHGFFSGNVGLDSVFWVLFVGMGWRS